MQTKTKSLILIIILLILTALPAAANATTDCYFYNNPDDSDKVYFLSSVPIDRIVRASWLSQDTWSGSWTAVSVTGDIFTEPGAKPGNGNKYAQYKAQVSTVVNGSPVYVDVCAYAGMNP